MSFANSVLSGSTGNAMHRYCFFLAASSCWQPLISLLRHCLTLQDLICKQWLHFSPFFLGSPSLFHQHGTISHCFLTASSAFDSLPLPSHSTFSSAKPVLLAHRQAQHGLMLQTISERNPVARTDNLPHDKRSLFLQRHHLPQFGLCMKPFHQSSLHKTLLISAGKFKHMNFPQLLFHPPMSPGQKPLIFTGAYCAFSLGFSLFPATTSQQQNKTKNNPSPKPNKNLSARQ